MERLPVWATRIDDEVPAMLLHPAGDSRVSVKCPQTRFDPANALLTCDRFGDDGSSARQSAGDSMTPLSA